MLILPLVLTRTDCPPTALMLARIMDMPPMPAPPPVSIMLPRVDSPPPVDWERRQLAPRLPARSSVACASRRRAASSASSLCNAWRQAGSRD